MCATPVSPPSARTEFDPQNNACPAAPVIVRWRGVEPYETSFDAMRAFTASRTEATPDELWLVEHPPVFTLGQAGKPEHLLVADSGIPLVQIDRGGQITYHGPGQVVAYLLLDLRRRRLMVRELVTAIEAAAIETLAAYNLAGERKAGAPGIYVAEDAQAGPHAGAKIAALGLKIRNGCSYHGVSLNVAMDLRPFLAINPCGYAGLETVDMATLGVAASWRDVAATLAARLIAQLDARLTAHVDAAAASPQVPHDATSDSTDSSTAGRRIAPHAA